MRNLLRRLMGKKPVYRVKAGWQPYELRNIHKESGREFRYIPVFHKPYHPAKYY